ncbi:AAA family ATPase [Natranaerofaba carboxydovora]|uniref:AAA family ATPase n=1 Tax=Natranaerofaba carboxydovora TaxID=2742683 RepID=UPI001F13265D|nr:AAA family ATPase [Natranaerofaba carboxydovora]UMZ74153.1 AAA ATPase domain protein [Natranaerofaba carboxydovora]
MQLEAVRVLNWQNFNDSGWVNVNKPVTTLVGKNESGKTAFLEALYRLNPAYSHDSKIDKNVDYPRWRKVSDEKESDLNEASFIIGKFSLGQDEKGALEELIKAPLPDLVMVNVVRTYGDKLHFTLLIDEKDAAMNLMRTEEIRKGSRDPENLDEVFQIAKSTKSKGITGLKGLKNKINRLNKIINGELTKDIQNLLSEYMPIFFRHSQFSQLKGSFYLRELLERKNEAPDTLTREDMTTIELLKLAGMEGPELISEDSERRIASLEAAAGNITNEVFEYWSQNRDLKVRFETREQIKNDEKGNPSHIDTNVDIRLEDLRHEITTNFDRRSSGFKWFFSFVAAFSSFKDKNNVIVLLDEPGRSLHGKAQKDFLRFVDEKLSLNNQVFYTSHSPFMVDPTKIERVRLVEDRSTKEAPGRGAVVLNDIVPQNPDTIFSIRGAISYNLANNMLFEHEGDHLIVREFSDLMCLELINDYLKELGRISLDSRFSLVPLGNMQNIPLFAAMNEGLTNATLLIDSSTKEMKAFDGLLKNGLLSTTRIISLSQITEKDECNIEDLFAINEYLEIFNTTFNKKITLADIEKTKPIVNQIYNLAGRYRREEAFSFMLKNKYAILPKLSEETIKRFEKLFEYINETKNPQSD